MAAYLTPAEVAERWQCDPSTVRKLIRARKLAAMQLGAEYRIGLDAVEAYERGHTAQTAVHVAEAGHRHAITASGSVAPVDFELPADYEPCFPDLWPGHEPQAKKRAPVSSH